MLILSYGYKKPEDNDTGAAFWDALAENIQKLNDHTHNGTNSALIPVQTQSISAGSWVATGTVGQYRQLVTLPGSLTYDNIAIEMRLSTGERVYPNVEKVSSTTYYVYTNDNSVAFTAVYAS